MLDNVTSSKRCFLDPFTDVSEFIHIWDKPIFAVLFVEISDIPHEVRRKVFMYRCVNLWRISQKNTVYLTTSNLIYSQ